MGGKALVSVWYPAFVELVDFGVIHLPKKHQFRQARRHRVRAYVQTCDEPTTFEDRTGFLLQNGAALLGQAGLETLLEQRLHAVKDAGRGQGLNGGNFWFVSIDEPTRLVRDEPTWPSRVGDLRVPGICVFPNGSLQCDQAYYEAPQLRDRAFLGFFPF